MCIDIYLYKYFCTKLERNMYTEHIYSSEARLIFYIFPLQLTRFHIQNRISIFSYSNSSYLCTWSKSSIAYMHLRCKSITKTKTNFNKFQHKTFKQSTKLKSCRIKWKLYVFEILSYAIKLFCKILNGLVSYCFEQIRFRCS